MINNNIISESKRDDMLLPYLQLLQSNGIDINIGQFKSKLLNKLSFEGGITNLSLRSNYYLAGTARYYFNGDLTTNKPVSLLNPASYEGNGALQDNWDVETCKKVNALINVLRNSYIDSVGTEMLEPEDFGAMPLAKLLRKYNKLIMKELGIEVKKKDGNGNMLDTNENVGNGYTFDIMYTQKMCEKYKAPTNPGSWCITYSQQHYNYYVKDLNIHYVIFRKNGWESIPRPQNPMESDGFTPEKPQDAYGNSLIAMLQSNNSPEPVYITSRWNHGYEVRCEANHAYTKEEFQRITGVSDADLKRIYDIWYQNKNKRHVSSSASKGEILDATRKLKYIQMRVNAGENIQTLVKFMSEPILGTSIKNGVYICGLPVNEQRQQENANERISAQFIVDRGRIVFDSIVLCNEDGGVTQIGYKYIRCGFPDNKKMKLYYTPSHSFVNVNGCVTFKYLPEKIYDDWSLVELRQSKMECALLMLDNGNPVKLPNGQFWCNIIRSNLYVNNTTICRGYEKDDTCVLEMVYDQSSGERYFYNVTKKLFVQLPKYDDADISLKYPGTDYRDLRPMISFNTCGVYGVSYACGVRNWPETASAVFNREGKRFKYKDLKEFYKATPSAPGYVMLEYYKNDNGLFKIQFRLLALVNTAEFIGLGDYPFVFSDVEYNMDEYLILRVYEESQEFQYIYSPKNKLFLVNPYNGEKSGRLKCRFNMPMISYNHKGSIILKTNDEPIDSEVWLNLYRQVDITSDEYKIVNLDEIYNAGYYVPAQLLSDYNTIKNNPQPVNEVMGISISDIRIMTECVLKRLLMF